MRKHHMGPPVAASTDFMRRAAHLMDLVDAPSVEKNTLCERCLPAIDVSADTNVSEFPQLLQAKNSASSGVVSTERATPSLPETSFCKNEGHALDRYRGLAPPVRTGGWQ